MRRFLAALFVGLFAILVVPHHAANAAVAEDWTFTTATGDWFGVAYGNNVFVAIAYSGPDGTNDVITSVDGVNWTPSEAPAEIGTHSLLVGVVLWLLRTTAPQ